MAGSGGRAARAGAPSTAIFISRVPGEGGGKARAIRILLIEDNRLVSRLIRDTLAPEGWEVVVREDGVSALAEIEGAEAYDLILTDNELPGINGVALARAARATRRRRRTPIIMFTASPVEREARAAGVDVFLRKPEDVGRLLAAVTGRLADPPGERD